MKIVAIDMAYKKPVWLAVLNEHGSVLFTLSLEPKDDVYALVKNLIMHIGAYGKCLVTMEKPLFIQNANTTFMMTQGYGMIQYAVRDMGNLFFAVHPSTWQSKLLHPKKGDDRKKLSVDYVENLLGRKISSNDEADAVCIGIYSAANLESFMGIIKGNGKKFSEKG